MFERCKEWIRNGLIDSGEVTHLEEVRKYSPDAGIDTHPIDDERALIIGTKNLIKRTGAMLAMGGCAVALALAASPESNYNGVPEGQATPQPAQIEPSK